MTATAFEIRQELKIRDDVLAFGFRGEPIADEAATQLIRRELLASVKAAENGTQPSFVVLDMRQVQFMSSLCLGRLISLNGMLGLSEWKLVLLGLPQEIRETFSMAGLDPLVTLVSDEDELRFLVEQTPVRPNLTMAAQSSTEELAVDFSEVEVEELVAAGITLDEAIRAIER